MAKDTTGRLHVQVKTGGKRKLSSKLWLERQLNDPYVAKAKAAGSLAGSIAATYAAAAKRADIEAPDQLAPEDALPSSGGMQVHSEYGYIRVSQ